jgi:hypothetical protein
MSDSYSPLGMQRRGANYLRKRNQVDIRRVAEIDAIICYAAAVNADILRFCGQPFYGFNLFFLR